VVAQADRSKMPQLQRFAQLSPARQMLVRVLQATNFGELQGICVQNADPVFDPEATVIFDVKLDKEEVPRPELLLADFALSAELQRLMSRLDELRNGTIQRLEVRAGVPRRIVLEARLVPYEFSNRQGGQHLLRASKK
jgi:hypothetical protein